MEKGLPPSPPHSQFCVLDGGGDVKAAKVKAVEPAVPTQLLKARRGHALRYLTVIEAMANIREDKVEEVVQELLKSSEKADVKPPGKR